MHPIVATHLCHGATVVVDAGGGSQPWYIFYFEFPLLGKGSKKIMENSIKGPDPPVMEFFFLKLDHFLRTICKKCILTIENPKNDKLLLNKQIFASSDAKFCRDTRNNSRYTQNFVHNMGNFSLDMVLSP